MIIREPTSAGSFSKRMLLSASMNCPVRTQTRSGAFPLRSLELRVLATLSILTCLAIPETSAQADRPNSAPLLGLEVLPTIGGIEDATIRLHDLIGKGARDGYLLRSPSSLLPAARRAARIRILQPELGLGWNSAIPNSLNTGPAWYGRGVTTHLLAGVAADLGPLSVVVAPQYIREQNLPYEIPYQELWRMDRDALASPWYIFPYSADLPLRFGGHPRSRLVSGQSSVTLRAGPLAAGAGTESQWWGPGRWNALVLSNNAPGIPHLFLRTNRPLHTALGRLEGKWIAGRLLESDYFDRDPQNDRRSLSAFALTLNPTGAPGLTVGISRSVYAALQAHEDRSRHLLNAFTRWEMRGDAYPDTAGTREQITALFGRWVFPGDGLEAYAEWARHRLPASFNDLLERPGFGQGYTLGLLGARPVGRGWTLRLGAETTNLEQTGRGRTPGSFYTSARVAQGYTHQGRIIGAAIGPGSSSQTASVDLLGERVTVGMLGGRIRWDNDTYYRKPYGPSQYYGHDVSLYGGATIGLSSGPAHLRLEVTDGVRLNYLWQNWGNSWETADSAVDVRNRAVRLTVQLRSFRRLTSPAPLAVVPLDSAASTRMVELERRGEGVARNDRVSGPDSATATRHDPSPPGPVPSNEPASAPDERVLVRHVVTAGETFYAIARRYRVSLNALQTANPGVTPERITVGQTVIIPMRSEDGSLRHVVAPGETLFGLARRYGVPLEELRRVNAVSGTVIRVGDTLVIPGASNTP